MGERRFEVPEAEAKSDRRAHPLVDRPEAAVRIERGPETSLAGPVRREGAVDEDKRWQGASESDDRFSPFRRHQPIVVGLVTGLIALISLAIFLSVAGLDIGQFLIATLVSITVMTLAGCCFTLLSNHRAKSSYLAEYRRLNKVNAGSARAPF